MTRYKHLYCIEALPVFQNRVFSTAREGMNCTRGDIDLVQDMHTGFVFNRAFKPELLVYDSNYQNEQGLSSAFQAHLQDVLSILDKHFSGMSIIEVGCGKGTFLEMLQASGYNVTGLDPTYEGVNPAVIKKYFSPETGLKADAIVLRHVLEHVQNPYEFLLNIKRANGGNGKVYIEVPCFDWICKKRAWFDVFYEHVNYFRLRDFYRLFGDVTAAGNFFGGQYLYVLADLESLQEPMCERVDEVSFPQDFLQPFNRWVSEIRFRQQSNKSPVVVWGGASKGVIFSLFMQNAGVNIDYVVDINPAKQGMFLPATGLKVSSPSEMFSKVPTGSDVFVMNGNYLPEIISMTRGKFNCMAVDYE